MTTDYRAMCAELVDALAEWQLGGAPPEDTADADLITRARALLAELDGPAVPDGREPASVALQPSDGEVLEIARTVDLLMEDGSTGYLDFADVSHLVVAFARAVLDRWGRQPAPVLVSERLPEPKDYDAEDYCWRWNTIGGLWARQPLARSWYEFESHWLPAYALPTPEATND